MTTREIEMIEYAAYALAVAGAYFLLLATSLRANTNFALIWGRLLPALIGAGCLWLSAIVLVQS